MGMTHKSSMPKWKLVNCLSKIFGDNTEITVPKKTKRNVSSLHCLALRVVSRFPKSMLNVVYGEVIFPERLAEWRREQPISDSVKVKGLDEPAFWYSQPEYHETLGTHLFGFLDGHHLLTIAWAKCCSTGLKACNIDREAWLKVAQNSKSNNSGLNISLVEDLIDRQDNAYAQKTFSYEVEQCMIENGDLHEAEFCSLIRHWYAADDEAGIDALSRCQWRLDFHHWLLSKYDYLTFPPPGSHVNDIPVIMYEGFLTAIERKIQMYAYVTTGSYNPRTVSSLDAENFFSDFDELDPAGDGVLRAKEVPRALSTAMNIVHAKMDTERGYHIRTSAAPYYPVPMAIDPSDIFSDCPSTGITDPVTNSSKITEIDIRDHLFDKVCRKRRKPKRKSGEVAPLDSHSRGVAGVRQFHKADESKILPHKRLGIRL